MIRGILGRIPGFIFHPTKTFKEVRGGLLREVIIYLVILFAIYVVLSTFFLSFPLHLGDLITGIPMTPITPDSSCSYSEWARCFFSPYSILLFTFYLLSEFFTMGLGGTTIVPYMISEGSVSLLGYLAFALLTELVVISFFSAWTHLWVYLLGGRRGWGQTFKAISYGLTPLFLVGWITFLSLVIFLWILILQSIGIRELHGLSIRRAVSATLLSSIVLGILFFLLFLLAMSRLTYW
ncbi:MAG TPA: YIP1 family protein [Methanomicrobiales archaeon]|jgi:hypothetical protein|nr:YIP1 family protein [Methanomicrobiales archaeon]